MLVGIRSTSNEAMLSMKFLDYIGGFVMIFAYIVWMEIHSVHSLKVKFLLRHEIMTKNDINSGCGWKWKEQKSIKTKIRPIYHFPPLQHNFNIDA